MAELLTAAEKYEAAVDETLDHADSHNRREFSTVANAVRFLRVFNLMLGGRAEADKTWLLKDLVEQESLTAGDRRLPRAAGTLAAAN